MIGLRSIDTPKRAAYSRDTAKAGPTQTPAVVVGANANGLGVVRSLGVEGVPVITLDDDRRRPGMHSRYARSFPVRGVSGLELVKGLMDLRARLADNPVLFLTYDYHVQSVSKHRAVLGTGFRFRLPEDRIVCELLHKSDFQRLAERNGFHVPRAVTIRSEQDLPNLRRIRYPAIIKPGAKELFFANKAPRNRRAFSREQAEAACREILPTAPDLIVQEWIEGAESDLYFCLQYRGEGGATVSSFTGRKLRTWPPQTGNTLSCIGAPDAASLLEPLTTSFFDAARFVGMCGLEFKRESPSGKLFLIEPTVGRTDWQEEIATLSGVNIPLAAYCYELGLPLPADKPQRIPVIWRAPTCYWRSIFATRPSRNRRPSGAKLVRAAWRVGDPVPFVFFWLESFGKALSRVRRWLRSSIEGGLRR